jgi:glycosyltransferase involved in cell wall biosynthesis
MEPKISVIIPVYNSEKYLERCLNSVINQIYKNLEIIIVNDGSIDSSLCICQKYAENDSRIIVIDKANEGVSMARNAGLNVATGEYIGFVDSDDDIAPTMYERLYTNIIKYNADVSVCGFAFCYKNSQVTNTIKNSQKVLIHNREDAIKNTLTGTYYSGQLCNKLFKAHLFRTERLDKKIKVFEDLQIFISILMRTTKLVFDSTPLYNYYMRANSAYNSSFNAGQLSAYTALQNIYYMLINHYPNLCKYVSAFFMQYSIHLLKKVNRTNDLNKYTYQKLILTRLKENSSFNGFISLKWQSKIRVILALLNIHLFNWFDTLNGKWTEERKYWEDDSLVNKNTYISSSN